MDGVRHDFVLDGTKILWETWGENVLIPLYDNEESVCGICFNGEYFYFQKNLQGDIISVTDKDANEVAKYTYDAWGVCTVTSDTSACSIATVNPFRYRGYYYDNEIGMYYLQSRYYDVVVDRFLNADEAPFLFAVGAEARFNLYIYCDCDPVQRIDINGHFYEYVAYLKNANTLDKFVRKLDRYINNNSDTWWKRLIHGTGEALLGTVKKFKIGLVSTMVGIVWGTIPKINDELNGLRYMTDEIRHKYSASWYSFSINLLYGSHVNQYMVTVWDPNYNRISRTIIVFAYNNIHDILRKLLLEIKVKPTKRAVKARYSYK